MLIHRSRLAILFVISAVGMLAILAACGGEDPVPTPTSAPPAKVAPTATVAPAGGAKFNALVNAAREEAQNNGTASMRYTGLREEVLRVTEAWLKAEHDIDIDLINEAKGYSATAASYVTETQASKTGLPMFGFVSQGLALSMHNGGALADVDWAGLFDETWPMVSRLAAESQVVEARDACVIMTWRLYVIGYNTAALKGDEVPTSWADLLDPTFKGRIGAGGDGSAIATSYLGAGPWGEERALEYAREFTNQEPLIFEGGSPAIAGALTSGEIIAGGLGNYQAFQEKNKGAPVDYSIPTDGAVYTPDVLCVVPGASHPNLARLVAAYWASQPHESEIVEIGGWSLIYPYFQKGHLAAKLDEQGTSLSALHDFSEPEESKRERAFRKVIAKELGTVK